MEQPNEQQDYENLSFPFYLYPGYPFAGYYDIDTYIKNLLKLNNMTKILSNNLEQNQNKILFHMTIGAPMEEYFKLSSIAENPCSFQYQQLFPEHLFRYAKQGHTIIHFIISPTKSFSIENFDPPLFIEKTGSDKWKIEFVNDVIVINSLIYDFQVYLFCTMMPTHDKRNEEAIEYINSKQNDNVKFICPIKNITQTQYDRKFVCDFYKNLNTLINVIVKHNGTVTCFSFAVFRENSNKSKYKNYVMFEELITAINWTNPNIFLGEWVYIESSYVVIPYCNNIESLSYVKSNGFKFVDSYILKINFNGIIEFMKPYKNMNTRSTDYLENNNKKIKFYN